MTNPMVLLSPKSLLLQGMSALLLQMLHPSVANALVHTGALQNDPRGRLSRTAKLTRAVLDGDQTAIRRFRVIHQGVDERLLLWVFATLAVTSIEAQGVLYGPVSPEQMEIYYDSLRPFAANVGISEAVLPPSYADLDQYYHQMIDSLGQPGGELQMTTAAQVIASALFAQRGRKVQWAVKVAGAGLIPESARTAFGLRWSWHQRMAWWLFISWLKRRPETA